MFKSHLVVPKIFCSKNFATSLAQILMTHWAILKLILGIRGTCRASLGTWDLHNKPH